MKKLISFFCILLVLTILGCNNNPTGTEDSNTLVVEAFLYSGEPINDIRLTGTVDIGSSDTTAPPVNDAEVRLIKNGNTYQLIQDPDRTGYYIYQGSDLTVEPGDNFFLEINYSGIRVSSSTTVPPTPSNLSLPDSVLILQAESGFTGGFGEQDTNSVVLKWENPDSSLYYVVLENLEANPEEISTGSFPGFDIVRRTTFSPSATSEFVIARRNLTYYGKHAAILYRVNQEYADLYESRNQDSRNLNEPLTNINNGLGVFSAFASDTVYFEVKSEE